MSKTVEQEIFADNIQPMAGLYIKAPVNRPQIDTFIMLDSGLEESDVRYVRDNRIEINNCLRSANIQSNVEVWDLKTYRYERQASTSVHTGGSLPPKTVEYGSNGYYGTLSRTSYVNNRYQTDEGNYVKVIDTTTAVGTRPGWSEAHFEYTASGWKLTWSKATNQPTMEYYEDGYYGTLEKVYVTTDTDTGRPTWEATW